jgi:hypothetical protein
MDVEVSSDILLSTGESALVLSMGLSVLEVVLSGIEVDALAVFTEEFSVTLELEVLPILESKLDSDSN